MKPLFLFLLFLVLTTGAQAEETPYRVGFVNVAEVLNDSLQVKQLESELKTSYETRKVELDKEQEKLNELEQQLATKGADMDFEERSTLEHRILSMRSKLKQELTWLEEDITIRKSGETSRLIKLLREVIEQVAKEKDIDLVFEGAVVYTSDRADLSDDVSERLKTHFYENQEQKGK
jgi:Skp family chaperone for outer membrane proteins